MLRNADLESSDHRRHSQAFGATLLVTIQHLRAAHVSICTMFKGALRDSRSNYDRVKVWTATTRQHNSQSSKHNKRQRLRLLLLLRSNLLFAAAE